MVTEKPVAACNVSVRFLGGFSLSKDSVTITDEINRSQKIWSVLSYLIVHRGRNIPQAEFIDMFWPDENSSNPISALKTLLCRIRSALEPLFGGEIDPILSQRGSYCWNRSILCDTDIDLFEALCAEASDSKLPVQERVEKYAKAIGIYRGDFLPKLSNQLWAVPLCAHYHSIYLQAVKAYAALLEATERYEEMTDLCTRASRLDNLDEDLHILTIRSLICQGKDTAALTRYEAATDLLYRNLGVRPSKQLRALYEEIMAAKKNLETDLEVIQSQLKETEARPGAFVCEYGFFREAYRLEARRAARNGTCVHIGLITVSRPDDSIPPLDLLSETMDLLKDVLVHNLRRGDVVSKYSGAQYVLMLPAANFEDSTMVLERIVGAFYRQHRKNFLKLSYKIRELEIK